MKLEKWALIAEIVGAGAIVISLVFVGLQIRESNTATYAATYDQLLADTINWRMELATHPETVRALQFFLGDNSEAPDSAGAQTAKMSLEAIVQIYERAYFARFYGRLNEAEWGRYQRAMCNPESHAAWARAKLDGTFFAEEFWQYISECVPE